MRAVRKQLTRATLEMLGGGGEAERAQLTQVVNHNVQAIWHFVLTENERDGIRREFPRSPEASRNNHGSDLHSRSLDCSSCLAEAVRELFAQPKPSH